MTDEHLVKTDGPRAGKVIYFLMFYDHKVINEAAAKRNDKMDQGHDSILDYDLLRLVVLLRVLAKL